MPAFFDSIGDVLRVFTEFFILFAVIAVFWLVSVFIRHYYMDLFHPDGSPADGPSERLVRLLRFPNGPH